MADCKPFVSNLDHNAEEFSPQSEMKKKVLEQIKESINRILCRESGAYDANLQKIVMIAQCRSVTAPRIVGEVLVELSTRESDRVSLGFRCFNDIRRGLLPEASSHFLDAVLNTLNSQSKRIISDDSMKQLCTTIDENCSEPSSADGDATVDKEAMVNHMFAHIMFLRLAITSFCDDDSCTCTCLPPTQPCVGLCSLLNYACKLHIQTHEASGNAERWKGTVSIEDECAIASECSWNGLLYSLFDGFYQGLAYFNELLVQQNVHVLSGSWRRTCSLDPELDDFVPVLDGYEQASTLSALMNGVLVNIRKLLLDERLSSILLRSTALDILLCASELAAIHNAAYSNWAMPNNVADEAGSDGTLDDFDDEKKADYEQFLKESGQL